MTRFLADTHIHVYPCHSARELITGAVKRLRSSAECPEAPCLLALTETSGDHWFEEMREHPQHLPDSFERLSTTDNVSLRIRVEGGDCSIVAGRQVVTRERLELLALGTTETFKDGLPIREAFEGINASGAIPVLAWAPGKWMGKRAAVVQEFIDACGENIWLGDSSLRAKGWPTPAPFKTSSRPVLAGSDPLPLTGEEHQAGSYGLRIEADFDPTTPFASFKHALSGSPDRVIPIGARNSALKMFQRLAAHRKNKGVGSE